MTRPLNRQIAGTNRGQGIPSGYLAGRPPGTGTGPLQLISIQQLQRFGLKSSKSSSGLGTQAGFTFSITNLVPANTLIGIAVWSKDLTFHNGDANNSGVDLVNPTAAYSFPLTDSMNNVVGNIDVSTAGVWSVVWASDPTDWPAGKAMQVSTQLLADATLQSVSARVVGYF